MKGNKRQKETKDKMKQKRKKSEVFPFRLLIDDLEFLLPNSFKMTIFSNEEKRTFRLK